MRRRNALPGLVAIALLPVLAAPARADWPAGGKYIMEAANSHNHARHVEMFDLPEGGFYIVACGRGGNAGGYSLQRLTATGEIPPGWPAAGVVLGTTPVGITPLMNGFAVDDSVCFWHSTTVSNPNGVGYHLVRPDASMSPSTLPWRVTNTSLQISAVAPGLDGDVYVVSGGTNLKRMDRAGALKTGWPSTGINFSSAGSDASLLPDGSGGVVWFQSFPPPVVKRYDATGLLHAGWPAAGLALTDVATDGNLFDPSLFRPLVRSGATHFFAAWTMPYNSTPVGIRLQRFSLDGTLAAGWAASGMEIAPAGVNVNESVTLIEDGSDGVYVLWYRDGTPVGTHVLADGSVLGTAQAPLLPAGASFRRPMYFLSVPIPYVMADVTPDGGLLFAWDGLDGTTVPRVRVRWLQPDFTPVPDEPSDGRIIHKAPQGPDAILHTLVTLHSDGIGGAYVAWEVMSAPPPNIGVAQVWMTRILPSALVDAPRPSPVAAKLALSAPRPNPATTSATFDLLLPDNGGARVELLDVAGRVLRTQFVEGAAAHAVSFDGLASLAPGLYFARVTSRGGSTAVRVVVSR
jgi:hypothetical protein